MVNKAIFKTYLEHFDNYVQNIPVSDEFKKIYFNDDFDTPAFYFYYPKLFSKNFNINEENIITLSIAGFLIYKAIIYNDAIIDNHHTDEKKNKLLLIKSNIYYEEGIKLISSIIPLNSNFWEKWYLRKIDLFKGIEFEKIKNKHEIDFADFERLAIWKCSIGKLAIDALLSIDSSDTENYSAICTSHDYFSMAMQILDDITDLKKDFESGQPNIALSVLKKELVSQNISFEELNAETLEKYLYITTISEQIYSAGINYLNKALKIVEHLNLEYWNNLLNSYQSLFTSSSNIINIYLKQVKAKALQSNEFIVKPNSKINKKIIYDRLTLANKYILDYQKANGSWEDFITSASASDIWATSFVINNLTSSYNHESMEKAIKFISDNNADSWGYKIGYPVDADSSTFSILALSKKNLQTPQMFEKLFEFQNEDGGFATYNEKNVQNLKMRMGASDSSDFSGWTKSHMCVSSVTLNLLLKYGYSQNIECARLKKYLLNRILNSGIETYWWTSNSYTLSMLIECLPYLGDDPLGTAIKDSAKEFIKNNINGALISDTFTESPFYTGLILKSVFHDNDLFNFSESIIIKTFEKILKVQFKDGSWLDTPSLRIPPPNEHFPDSIQNYKIFELGIGVRAPEYNRLFTTSTIAKALENLINVI